MNGRQGDILNTVVREFIRVGIPIGSKLLFEDHDFGISPALIRAEMHELMELGYLSQPHTSGGRVPTDKGYRFFVESMRSEVPVGVDRELERMERVFSNFETACHDMVDFLSDHLNTLSLGYEHEPRSLYKRGLDSLIRDIETDDRSEIVKIVSGFEELGEQFNEQFSELSSTSSSREDELPRVFIGKENPFVRSNQISIMYDTYELPDGDSMTMLIVGPKRMNYKRSMTMLRALKQRIEKQE